MGKHNSLAKRASCLPKRLSEPTPGYATLVYSAIYILKEESVRIKMININKKCMNRIHNEIIPMVFPIAFLG
jgi:hypothetical protein